MTWGLVAAGTVMAVGSYMAADRASDASDAAVDAGAQASEDATQLGRDQLEEGKRQYDLNMDTIRPIIDAQVGIMNETLGQAQDSYNWSRQFRPIEAGMLGFVNNTPQQMAAAAKERSDIQARAQAGADEMKSRVGMFDAATLNALRAAAASDSDIASGLVGLANATGGNEVQNNVDRAVADVRAGQTSAYNTAIRQALRYGMSPGISVGNVGLTAASQQAGAATGERIRSVQAIRDRALTSASALDSAFRTSQAATGEAIDRGVGALSTARNQRIQDESTQWGRALDVAALGRGMVGASQGAYALATSAGNSAAQNQIAPGNQLLSSMASGANTTLAGRGLQLGALNNAASQAGATARQWQNDFGTFIGMTAGRGR